MLTNRKEIYVEWGQCDPGNIVYYPRYLEYCDDCTHALFSRVGLPLGPMFKTYAIAGIPMVDLRARFFTPSQFGDTIVIESCVSEWGNTSFSVQHRILKGDVLAAEIVEKRAWVAQVGDDSVRYKAQPIPQVVKEMFLGSPAPGRP